MKNYVWIDNFETNEMKKFEFDSFMDALNFAESLPYSEDVEICIGDEICAIELSDYYCMCFG